MIFISFSKEEMTIYSTLIGGDFKQNKKHGTNSESRNLKLNKK